MLELELGGKVVTTTDEIQTLKINGNPVEIERVGNSIYVNKQAINLIVVDDKNRWKSVLLLGILIPVVAGTFYLLATNHETVVQGFGLATEFIQSTVIPAVGSTVDTIGGLINGNEADHPSGK